MILFCFVKIGRAIIRWGRQNDIVKLVGGKPDPEKAIKHNQTGRTKLSHLNGPDFGVVTFDWLI